MRAAQRETEAVALVEGLGSAVRFAHLEKDAPGAGAATAPESFFEQVAANSIPARCRLDGEVEDFYFVGDHTRSDEADDAVAILRHPAVEFTADNPLEIRARPGGRFGTGRRDFNERV